MATSKVTQKFQIVIPREIRDKVRLNKGDRVDVQVRKGKIILTPVEVIPKAEAWYCSKEWQRKVKGSAKDLEKGRAGAYKSVAQLRRDLGD